MRLQPDDLADNHKVRVQMTADPLEGLDLDAGHGEPVGQLICRHVYGDVAPKP